MNVSFSPVIISVSQLNTYVKSIIESDDKLRYVFVTGEISNLTNHYASGHIYLSLKDDKSLVKAVMFSFATKNLKFRPENGMKVIARGRISVYEPSGQYQLYIEDMQPDGIGSLTIAYEQLKKKIEAEGLFDSKHKKQIPAFPKKITIITSPTGAALQDIRNILVRRWPYSEVTVVPVLVQGEGAAAMLTKAVRQADKDADADVIIIGRGGGSVEDLWAFNSEELARAIFDCKIPVISAVGHETDFTICDFVSDMRAPTPSAAAELATPDKSAQMDLLHKQRQYLIALSDMLIQSKERELAQISRVFSEKDPGIEFQNKLTSFSRVVERMSMLSEKLIEDKKNSLDSLKLRLFSLDPKAILRRGYCVTEREGKIISSSSCVKSGDKLNVIFSDGKILTTVD